ncbi:MAG: hypothetical protein HDS83_08540 [Bacteroidales bacterium]|nr:hypothetical protein [Bacteroidales bacterium]MDE5809174.1 hypothetical protein [Muribaculaceae bacterium]
MEEPILNSHNKQEYPPMHTAEHLLNATMVKMFGCPRSERNHIERTKSKCDYRLDRQLTDEELQKVSDAVNEVINRDLKVEYSFISVEEATGKFNLDRLPDDASSTLRIVTIGDYDACPCVGSHVESTSQIGHFRISSSRYADGWQRIVFRLDD